MKDNFFGISNDIFLSPEFVKVIDGIAGAAKSTNVDTILREAGVTYGRYTSTNKLRHDAEERFGGACDTICRGLFDNASGFYGEPKAPEFNTVVIDEVLQSHPRIFDWCRQFRGYVNIIICTDSQQLLAPEMGDVMERRYREFCDEWFVAKVSLEKSYRPRTAATAELFDKLYRAVRDGKNPGPVLHNFPVVAFDDIIYNPDDVYITHTKALESKCYDEWGISNRYELELIPKSVIARRKVRDATKYPILPQERVGGRQIGYWQVANIATPTRYQGSEVKQGHTLFYILEPQSMIDSRELYTVLTRCWDIDSVRICYTEIPKKEHIETFFGKPIKEQKLAELPVGTKLPAADGKNVYVDYQRIQELASLIEDTDTIHYSRDIFMMDGKIVRTAPDDSLKTHATTVHSLLAKCPEYSYSYMDGFYGAYERAQLDRYGEQRMDYIQNPILAQKSTRARSSYHYGLDLCASYPTILKHALLPVDGAFYHEPGHGIDFYLVQNEAFGIGCVCTKELVDALHIPAFDCTFIGSTPARIGSAMGNRLYYMSHQSQETNKARKQVRYGYMQRPYLVPLDPVCGVATAYARSTVDCHQPLMIAILSQQAAIIARFAEHIAGRQWQKNTVTCCDALYFDSSKDPAELGAELTAIIPWVEFRVFENGEKDKNGNIFYQNFSSLETAEEKRKRQRREANARARAAIKDRRAAR